MKQLRMLYLASRRRNTKTPQRPEASLYLTLAGRERGQNSQVVERVRSLHTSYTCNTTSLRRTGKKIPHSTSKNPLNFITFLQAKS
ncbi:hypothetical protein [Pontibacter sp. BAB1700]|uniref:hypothetical protein n=1 Tax=Pontibacter sp. BAB1700 TaxID=1144253 RepID=UPI0012DF84E9|nr:hypothetical protein [Pontibacter sp. BAB1700]